MYVLRNYDIGDDYIKVEAKYSDKPYYCERIFFNGDTPSIYNDEFRLPEEDAKYYKEEIPLEKFYDMRDLFAKKLAKLERK
jgi:hypothetical protein